MIEGAADILRPRKALRSAVGAVGLMVVACRWTWLTMLYPKKPVHSFHNPEVWLMWPDILGDSFPGPSLGHLQPHPH